MVLFSCKRKEYKYEIHGKVYVPTSGINPLHNAVWYTDTISFDGDTIYYFNSDGSKVRIKPPYFIINNLK
jgi:YHS domain-containing protein